MTLIITRGNARLPQLDLLRGAAVLLVIWNHYPFMRCIGAAGWIGVDLFFVLSGFLISGLLFTELKERNTISLGRFYVRRAFKIVPAYYVFLAAGALIDPATRHGYLPELLFVQNYFPRMWGHTWSLAVEEHFYAMLPLTLLILARRDRLRSIPTLAALLATACLAMRALYCLGPHFEAAMFFTHTRIDALFVGVAMGYWYHYKYASFQTWRSPLWLAVAAVLLLPAFLLPNCPRTLTIFSSLLNAIAFASVLAWMVNHPNVRFRLLEQIGHYSYSIYLWHLAVVIFTRSTIHHSFFMFIVTIAACIVLGVTMAQIVELPFLALRDRLFPQYSSRGEACAEPSLVHAG